MLNLQIYMENSGDIQEFRNAEIDGVISAIDDGKIRIEYDVNDGEVTVRVCEKNENNGEFEEIDSYIDSSILRECTSLADIGKFMIEDNPGMQRDY